MIDAVPPFRLYARLDAPTEVVWGPTWKLATRLSPLEREPLRLPVPRRLHLDRLAPGAPTPEGGLVASRERLYLDLPRVRGRLVAEEASRREDLRARAAGRVGRFVVSWR